MIWHDTAISEERTNSMDTAYSLEQTKYLRLVIIYMGFHVPQIRISPAQIAHAPEQSKILSLHLPLL